MSLFLSFFCYLSLASILLFVFFDLLRDESTLRPIHTPILIVLGAVLMALGLMASAFSLVIYGF